MLAHERLGFKTYADYLNSDLWRTIRSRVFDRDGYGFVREILTYGGMPRIRLYGTGNSLGFPMGNCVGGD